MNTKLIQLIIIIMSIFSVLSAGTDGTIRGKVLDVKGESVPGAQVYIQELGIGAMSDIDGNYIILNIHVGSYDVTIAMIGYATQVVTDVEVMMDQTVWLNFAMQVQAVEGDVIYVSGERALVEKNETSKKVTMSKETIEALPIRDITDLYTLQSGVVKVESKQYGIPGHEERGLVEMHVRGGRAGEIAYMIDGMYIRNPIFGGIGTGTRLNLSAIKEFDWQPGGFSAEYGDAMSAVSNWHTYSGAKDFKFNMSYKTSMVGAQMGNEYDELRGYNDYNMGFGGKLPFINMYYWVSGQKTDNNSSRVFDFDDVVYDFDSSPWMFEDHLIVDNPDGDPFNLQNKNNLVQPFDTESDFIGFGFDRTWDIFGKLTFNPITKLKMEFSYWVVENHRKVFNNRFRFWDEGQNELFRDTERFAFNINHSLTSKTFYNLRFARFTQDMFQGVRWIDNDTDGYPDWFEWRHPAGNQSTFYDDAYTHISDIYNPDIIPYSTPEGSSSPMSYTQRDYRSGWYYGATPGLYNWEVADEFIDNNGNGLFDQDIDIFVFEDLNGNGTWDGEDVEGPYYEDHDIDGNGQWNGPEMVSEAYYRDDSYWLYPEMYVDYSDFMDYSGYFYNRMMSDPLTYGSGGAIEGYYSTNDNANDPYYFLPTDEDENWDEGYAFGGHDLFYGLSTAQTDEARLDFTSQLTNQLKIRTGVDYKKHKLNFYEVIAPWDMSAASIQTFAEYWYDDGPDQISELDPEYIAPDFGESNGKYDEGENYEDFNGNGKWDNFVEPNEFSGYIQGTYELPWMVINAGMRTDGVNYNTKIYSDPQGNFSPNKPYFYIDCGTDNKCPGDDNYFAPDLNETQDNDIWDSGEITTAAFGVSSRQKPIFKDSEWLWKFSPRLGISHVITDQATFVFNYGLYYQTPTYNSIFMNINRQADPEELFGETSGAIGNGTMTASRTQSYEFGFNVQVGQHWAYSLMGWVKDMDQLVTSNQYRSGVYTYQVFSNGDYGTAKGIDVSLENRGLLINTVIHYTLSQARANSEYDWASLDNLAIYAPSQEFMMPFDRTHNLIMMFYTYLPFGINASTTLSYQSGQPYTPIRWNGDSPEDDVKNKLSLRGPAIKNVNLSFSKYLKFESYKVSLGLDIYNVFDLRNAIDVYPITGEGDDPGTYYTENIGLPYMVPDVERAHSATYYDAPWNFMSPREINFFIKFDFK